jgi:integrase
MARTKGIYRRGKIYWIRYAGLDGRIVFESSHSEKFRDAEILLTKRRRSIDEGKQPEPIKKIGNHTFNELVEEYTKWAERQRCFKSKTYMIEQLKQTFGNLPLRRFNTMLLEQFQSERLQKGKEREIKPGYKVIPVKGNKPATVNRFMATISHMFTKAVEWDMVEEEVLKRVRKVKMLPENNKRLRYLSKEECAELIGKCDTHVKPIVIMALNTGMRKGEILSLRWENVDLKHGFILLSMTKNGERREIPVNETLRATLKGLTRRLDTPYVFYDPSSGSPYDNVKRSFKTALKNAKIDDFKFHDLRHTFASHLVMAGVDLTTVKELLGHKDIKMTLPYAHLAPAHKVKAVGILDDTLTGRPTIQKLDNQAGSR